MKKLILFVVKLALVVALATFAYRGFFYVLWEADWGPRAYDHAYQNAILKQYNALADSERENMTIIFGASYVPYGVDKVTMDSILEKDVQILGVEASFSTTHLMDILYETVKPGDTVCYMLGCSNEPSRIKDDFPVMSIALESDKEKLKTFWSQNRHSLKDYKNIITWRKVYSLTVAPAVEVVRKQLSDKEQIYDIASFDENGNMMVEREGTVFDTSFLMGENFTMDLVPEKTIEEFNEFSNWCAEHDVKFYVVYGPYIDETINSSEEEIQAFHKELEELLDAEILLTPEKSFMPIQYFYNHQYHLNSEGARIYSEMIAEAIKEMESK